MGTYDVMPDWDALMDMWTRVQFSAALGVPVGQKFGEFDKDGKHYGAVLEGQTVYVFELPEWWSITAQMVADKALEDTNG